MKITKYISLIALSLGLLACQGPGNAEENVKLVEDYVTAVQNLDYEAMSNFLADDYMGYGPSINDSINKTEGIASWQSSIENLYERIEYQKSRNFPVTVASGDYSGDWVSNWAELQIVYQDGSSVTVMANTIYRIENNKISKSYTFYNEADVLEQLGFIFINPDDL